MADTFIIVKRCGGVRQAEPSQAGVRIMLRKAQQTARTEEVEAILTWMKGARPGDSLRFCSDAVLLATAPESVHSELGEKKTVTYAYLFRSVTPELEDEIMEKDEPEDEDEDEEDEEYNPSITRADEGENFNFMDSEDDDDDDY